MTWRIVPVLAGIALLVVVWHFKCQACQARGASIIDTIRQRFNV